MMTPLGFVGTETGTCDCGTIAAMRYTSDGYVCQCDECREYFKAGFNVVVK